MAVPKRRHTSSRRDRRRTHDNLAKPAVTECAQCGEAKESYTVCKTCGYYRKKEVVEILD